MTSPAPLPSSSGPNITRANWLGRYLDVERDFDDRLKTTLTDALSHVDDAFDSVKENFSGKVRRQQYAAAKKAMRDVLSHVFGVTHENIKRSRSDAAIAAVDAELYEERGILSRIFPDPVNRKQYADSLRQTASRNVENVVARTLFSERPLSASVYKSEAYANNLVSQAVNRGLARGDAAKEIAQSVKHMIDPNTPGGISYAARRLGTTEVNNAFHATAIKTAQDVPWVGQMEWHLSKVHKDDPGDECEIYSIQRYFDAEHVPDKPHPFCRCYVTPKQQDYPEFENALLAGQYDQYLDSVLGVDTSKSAREAEPQWPAGTTEAMKKEYEKALAKGETSLWPSKGASPAQKKAYQKLTTKLQNAALEAETASAETASEAASRIISDDIIPESIGEAANAKQVANYLTNRYEGLQVSGFDTADIDVDAAKEIATGVAERIAKTPRINLRAIRIADLPPGENARTDYNLDGKHMSDILFSRSKVADYKAFKATQKNLANTGYLSKTARDVERPWYSTTIHEFGHVLDFSGNSVVERGLQGLTEDQMFTGHGIRIGRPTKIGPGLLDRFIKYKNPDYVVGVDDPPQITEALYTEYEDWFESAVPSDYSRDEDGNIYPLEAIAEMHLEFMKNPKAKPATKAIVQELYSGIKENKRLKVVIKDALS